jgi:hypothetical protein
VDKLVDFAGIDCNEPSPEVSSSSIPNCMKESVFLSYLVQRFGLDYRSIHQLFDWLIDWSAHMKLDWWIGRRH